MSEGQPLKAHVIDQSLNESIVMGYCLLPPVDHQLTDLFSFHNYNDRQTGQSKAKYKLHQLLECLECRNSKSFRQNYTLLNVNISALTQFMDLRNFGNLFVQSSTFMHVLSKSEIWPKIWLEGLQKVFYLICFETGLKGIQTV